MSQTTSTKDRPARPEPTEAGPAENKPRKKALGLLRAVGATREQVRSTVRWEAMLVALTGGILGVGVGVLLGWGVVQALEDQGITEFAVPVFRLAASVLLTEAGGLLAAALLATRASRIDVLRAIAIE